MGVQFAITFLLIYCPIFIYGAEVTTNLRRESSKATEINHPANGKEQAIIPQVESNSEAKDPNFVERLLSNVEETRLLIQWKQAVVDNAALLEKSSTTQINQGLESVSFSKLLEIKSDLLNGNVPNLNANSNKDEGVKVMLDSPRFGFSAVAGTPEALNQYDLASHPAVKRVEIDMFLEHYGFVDNPPDDIGDKIGSNRLKKTSSTNFTRNMQSTDTVPYGVTMVQAQQIEHHPTNKMRVCVVDTGMDIDHQDLPKASDGLLGWNHATDYGDQKWYIDGEGHGTHVAGTVAAIKNNVGVLGVEDDPSRFDLSIGKGLSDNGGGYTSVILEAILTCVNDHNASVVNLSLGAPSYSVTSHSYYNQLYDQGVLIVAAAGNDGNSDFSYPASYPTVMSVAAVASSRNVAYFSQYNSQVEISGPGVQIQSTLPNNNYQFYSGTSMASPHVAGVALKVWSWFPQCSNTQIRNVLLRSASTVGGNCNINYGYGIIQAADALQMLQDQGCEAGGITPEPRHSVSPGGCQQLSSMQTSSPTAAPTNAPTTSPTSAPTAAPTNAPTSSPTSAPTAAPTNAPTSSPTSASTVPPQLITGTLPTSHQYYSSNGAYFLIFQGDGNLVLYGPSGALWWSGTSNNGDMCIMQPDGNLVIYANDGSPTWHSGTFGNPGASLAVSDNGILSIYDQSGNVVKNYGTTGTLPAWFYYYSPNREYSLVCQGDGNLVIYGPSGALWWSGTSNNGDMCIMQPDGNLVIYTNDGSPTWHSGTSGNPGAYFAVSDNGNLGIYDQGGNLVRMYESNT